MEEKYRHEWTRTWAVVGGCGSSAGGHCCLHWHSHVGHDRVTLGSLSRCHRRTFLRQVRPCLPARQLYQCKYHTGAYIVLFCAGSTTQDCAVCNSLADLFNWTCLFLWEVFSHDAINAWRFCISRIFAITRKLMHRLFIHKCSPLSIPRYMFI